MAHWPSEETKAKTGEAAHWLISRVPARQSLQLPDATPADPAAAVTRFSRYGEDTFGPVNLAVPSGGWGSAFHPQVVHF